MNKGQVSQIICPKALSKNVWGWVCCKYLYPGSQAWRPSLYTCSAKYFPSTLQEYVWNLNARMSCFSTLKTAFWSKLQSPAFQQRPELASFGVCWRKQPRSCQWLRIFPVLSLQHKFLHLYNCTETQQYKPNTTARLWWKNVLHIRLTMQRQTLQEHLMQTAG